MNGVERASIDRTLQWALIVAGIGLIACLIGACTNLTQLFLSYLVAVLIWLGVALGSLAWAMIHYLTGGRWGYAMRRFFEADSCTMAFLLVLFVPSFFGLYHVCH